MSAGKSTPSDRELLEMAAKAAGMNVFIGHPWPRGEIGWFWCQHGSRGTGLYETGLGNNGWWNPITDDGDAFRLAVDLGIGIVPDRQDAAMLKPLPSVWAGGRWHVFNDTDGLDARAATRRAIVRAAAALSKARSTS